MAEVAWLITNPGGVGTSTLAGLNLSAPVANYRILGVSTASMSATRDLDSEDPWWADDEVVTIYRDLQPFFTGRVQESPDNANDQSEGRTLNLADAWDDLEKTIYMEPWSIGGGTVLYPRCILGRNSAGANITTGQQIGEAIDYAISRGVAVQKGDIDGGVALWPSEARNISCEEVIVGELRFHPDWAAWLDHTTSPPTFHARVKSALSDLVVDISAETTVGHKFAKVVRNVPLGVRIIYESASTIDGEVFRNGYLDEAGVTTGRRVMQAMLDLEGLTMQFQKSRIQTRTLPTDGATMKAYFKKKWPELADVPDAAFTFSNVSFALAAEDPHPPAICPKAERLNVANVSDLPRELVSGSIEDWMRVKVGRVIVKYDLKINGTPDPALKKILDNFAGTGKTFSVTATDAVSKRYKGITQFTEGEGKPDGLAAAVFAAATEDQYEGSVSIVKQDVDGGTFHARNLILKNGATTLMPGAIVHSASMDIETGTLDLEIGPLPYLSAGDFLELQRMFKRRPVTWMGAAERASNLLGAEAEAGSKGDTVTGYDIPDTIVPPGGGEKSTPSPFYPTLSGSVAGADLAITMLPGFVLCMLIDSTADAANNITVTGIPDEESTAIGNKYWATATESATGVMTVASVGSGVAWPNSAAPQLIGGDDQIGASGTRIFRLCEILADGDDAKVKIWRTGHVQHSAARRLENLITSASTNQARLVKKFNKDTGEWEFRYLIAGPGIEIIESASSIQIKVAAGASSHPWKATEDGSNIIIAPGKVFFVLPNLSAAPEDLTPFVYDYVSYPGGSLTPGGPGFYYAKCAVGDTVSVHGQEMLDITTGSGTLNSVLLQVRQLTAVTVEFSGDGPADFTGAAGFVYHPIVQVDVGTVVDQILTHNPKESLHKINFS